MSEISNILKKWASKEGVQFKSSEAEKEFEERAQRVGEAIQLKVPDRIPIAPDAEFFPPIYAGVSLKEVMYDYNKAYAAWSKTLIDFKWDAAMPPFTYSGKVFEILRYRQIYWPGCGLKDDATIYQFIEPWQQIKGEVIYEGMKPEEYDWFIEDPSDYIIRGFLPKISGVLAPFRNLYPIHAICCWYQGLFESLATPDIDKAFQALADAARETSKWLMSFIGFVMELKSMGFPVFTLSATHAPFDFIANFFRGTRGAFLDIYRIPEKIKAACKKITPFMVEAGIVGAKATGNPIVSIFLHKGVFMNINQYKEFYWPTLKEVLLKLIDNGILPYVYTEGDYTKYLDIIKDMPKGRIIYHVEKDIFKAKEILGDKFCLTGGIPVSLLQAGTPKKVEEYCEKAFEVLGENGGFILDTDLPLAEAKPENLKAVNDAILKYGVYRK